MWLLLLSSSPSCQYQLQSIPLSSDPTLKSIPSQINKIKTKLQPLLIISIHDINIMLPYHQLLLELLPQLITVTYFFHMIQQHNPDKMYKKITINGMVRWEAISMEDRTMSDTLQKDMLLSVENAPNTKKHNKKVFSMTGTKSPKLINKHSLTYAPQEIEPPLAMISKSKQLHQPTTSKGQIVEVVLSENTHEFLHCIEGQLIKGTLMEMSISSRIMSLCGPSILKYDPILFYIYQILFSYLKNELFILK